MPALSSGLIFLDFGAVYCLHLPLFDILGECTVFIIRLTELVWLDGEMIDREIYVDYIVGLQFEVLVVWQPTATVGRKNVWDCPKPMGVEISSIILITSSTILHYREM
jgi:hypothetical protein